MSNAFAGVGKPIKPLVCLVSTLNFAKRYAEAIVISKPINGIMLNFIPYQAIEEEESEKAVIPTPEIDSFNNWNITIPGTTPLVITSAKESN